MIEVKRQSEIADMLYHYKQWKNSTAQHLWDVYGKFSNNKARAFARCEELMFKMGGRRIRILSHNSFSFTVGFEFPHPETGVLCFAYITPSYDKWIEVKGE